VLHDGKPNFPMLQQKESTTNPLRIDILSRQMPATFVAFDLLFLGGESIMGKPLTERKMRLAEVAKLFKDPHFLVTDFVIEHGQRYFQEIERFGLEGVMAKRIDSQYLPGKRSSFWLKIKVSRTAIFDVIGYIQRGNQPLISSLLLGERTAQGLRYRGRVGSGLTEVQRRELYAHLTESPRMANAPRGAKAEMRWVEVKLKVKVRFTEETKSGHLRAPVLLEIVEEG